PAPSLTLFPYTTLFRSIHFAFENRPSGRTPDAQVSSCLPIGNARMRLPVAAKMAFIKAGANGGRPGSPAPLGGVSAAGGTIWTRSEEHTSELQSLAYLV